MRDMRSAPPVELRLPPAAGRRISLVAMLPAIGGLCSLRQLAIVRGIFVALLVDFVIAAAAGGAARPFLLGLPAWRWMFISEAIPALISLLGSLRIPESPRYLVATGHIEESRF